MKRQNFNNWLIPCDSLNVESIDALFQNQRCAIILRNFLPESDCAKIVENLAHAGMSSYSHVDHHVGRFGLTQMEYYVRGDKAGYFREVETATRNYRSVIRGVQQDPIASLLEKARSATRLPVDVVREPDLELPYFAGTFRNITTVGHLHFDFALIETQGWEISNVVSQLTWNLYLNTPSGGVLNVLNRQYVPDDERFRVKGNYYYDRSRLISGDTQIFSYVPKVGELVIFNSRNFHEIESVQGDRYALSSFLGKFHRAHIKLWS